MSDPWWTCSHDGIGLPGCPFCDPFTHSRHGRPALYAARDEIARLTAERDVLDSALGNLLARIFRNGGQRAGELSMDDALHLADETIAAVCAERDALRAAVERVRPVVDGLAVACDKAAKIGDSDSLFDRADVRARNHAEQALVILRALPATGRAGAAALRALLAGVPEVAP